DYLTRHILLRYDSSGDLYPVTKPSTSPAAFLSTRRKALDDDDGDMLMFISSLDSRYIAKKRSLYGLKQAPRAWFQQFAGYATRAEFYHSRCDSSLFIYRQDSQITGSLNNEFDMTDLGVRNYFLGISANRTPTGLFLSQKKYALQLLERAHMITYNPSRTPVDIESKLGPEVQQIFLYMHDPREPHFAALKRILRYVQSTLDLGLHLPQAEVIFGSSMVKSGMNVIVVAIEFKLKDSERLDY
ncbi:ribonuclease H-like domain-containing protein, partial [Tanacetum coccineum]